MEIAGNLVAAASSSENLSEDALFFLHEWLVIGAEPLRAFIDTWNIVLNDYTPNHFPILFRAMDKRKRLNTGRICSYTGSFEVADRFMRSKIVVLDTAKVMEGYTPEAMEEERKFMLEIKEKHGIEYEVENIPIFSFYPLTEVLSQHDVCTSWIHEDEYVVREPHSATSVWCRQRQLS